MWWQLNGPTRSLCFSGQCTSDCRSLFGLDAIGCVCCDGNLASAGYWARRYAVGCMTIMCCGVANKLLGRCEHSRCGFTAHWHCHCFPDRYAAIGSGCSCRKSIYACIFVCLLKSPCQSALACTLPACLCSCSPCRVGVFTFILGLLRVGFLGSLFSRPILDGFVSASASIIIIEQCMCFG
jgi:hypothetical protein